LTFSNTDPIKSDESINEARVDTIQHFLAQTSGQAPYIHSYEEPMKVDNYQGI
jgi:hypothetical protein